MSILSSPSHPYIDRKWVRSVLCLTPVFLFFSFRTSSSWLYFPACGLRLCIYFSRPQPGLVCRLWGLDYALISRRHRTYTHSLTASLLQTWQLHHHQCLTLSPTVVSTALQDIRSRICLDITPLPWIPTRRNTTRQCLLQTRCCRTTISDILRRPRCTSLIRPRDCR